MRISFSIVLLLFFLVSSGVAQKLQDDQKVDTESIKKVLDQLEHKQLEELSTDFESFSRDLSGALGSEEEAVKFYQTCVRKVDFEGKALDSNEWNEWKTKNAELLGDKNFKKGLLLQLRYLQLWAKAYKKTELVQLEDSLVALCFEIENWLLPLENEKSEKTEKKGAKKSNEPIKNSLGMAISASYFSKAYHLDMLLKETKEWDLTLSSSEQILERLLMGEYRASKNPRLFDLWTKRVELSDLKMKYLSLSNEQKLSHENEVFSFQWKQAQDLKLFGLQNKAVNLMMSIVSKAPDHPQFESWTKEIREILGIKSSIEK